MLQLFVILTLGLPLAYSVVTIGDEISKNKDSEEAKILVVNSTICRVPAPLCNESNLHLSYTDCDFLGSFFPGYHHINFKCKDDRPGSNSKIEESCFALITSDMVYYIDYGWSDCAKCEMYQGNCPAPVEYPGVAMVYTDTSCGSKVLYSCQSGVLSGTEGDTCLRFFNDTSNRLEMNWERKITGVWDTPRCLATCSIDRMNQTIPCGTTVFPSDDLVALEGEQITWTHESGQSMAFTECLPNGTWSTPTPCCDSKRGSLTECAEPGRTCGINSPQCDTTSLQLEIYEVNCNFVTPDLPDIHQVIYKCKDRRPASDDNSENNCFTFSSSLESIHLPESGWSECPVCRIYEGNCSDPLEFPGATMTHTGTTCGSKIFYNCNDSESTFGGFDVDTCIRYFNRTASQYEMRWHSEINGQRDTQGCVSTCPIDQVGQQVQCGSTIFPTKNAHAIQGQRIQWAPKEGYNLNGPAFTECRIDGTWSNPTPCCYRENEVCTTLEIPDATVKANTECVLGVFNLQVDCNEGFVLYGEQNFTCNGGLLAPQGKYPPSCVPITGKLPCIPPPTVPHADVVRVHYETNSFPRTRIVYTCRQGYRRVGSSELHCVQLEKSLFQSPMPICVAIL